MANFTKVDFANSVIALVNGEIELTPELSENLIDKAYALLQVEENRKAYAETHPSKSKAKGASDKTKALAKAIVGVLSATPMTSDEIAKAVGQDITALNIANALKYADVEIVKSKVKRTKVNSKGCSVESLYTAYAIV